VAPFCASPSLPLTPHTAAHYPHNRTQRHVRPALCPFALWSRPALSYSCHVLATACTLALHCVLPSHTPLCPALSYSHVPPALSYSHVPPACPPVPPAQRLELELKEVRDRIAWRTRGGKGNPAPQAATASASSLLPRAPSDDATAVRAAGPGSVAVGEGEGLDDGGSHEDNDTSSGSGESESEGDVGDSELVSAVASLSFGEDSGRSGQGVSVSDGRASVEDVVPLLQPPPQVAVPSDK
jgi:hypothetical protein